jgi:hypothetical protein
MLTSHSGRAARLHYMPNSYRVLVSGDHVVCAVTGQPVALDNLKYWSVERQEPYATAEAATRAILGASAQG